MCFSRLAGPHTRGIGGIHPSQLHAVELPQALASESPSANPLAISEADGAKACGCVNMIAGRVAYLQRFPVAGMDA